MNISEIQDLIKFVSKSGVHEVEIEKKDFRIVIKAQAKYKSEKPIMVHAGSQMMQAPAAQLPQTPSVQTQETEKTEEAKADSKLITVKSPMIGTFYRSSGPDKEVFVQVGSTISKGDTVCIIEAMKLFNEIESEISGKIVKILVDDASPVEYDQPLFMVEPA